MQYTFETAYDQTALTAMAKCLRKTVRRAHSKKSHLFGWIVIALAILLSFSGGEEFSVDLRRVVTWAAAGVMLLALVFEDWLNGFIAGKRMLKGTETATATFDTEAADTFVSETAVGKTEFRYDSILAVAETGRYFVFLLSANHGQLYDKQSLQGGTAEQFRAFITERTGKPAVTVET